MPIFLNGKNNWTRLCEACGKPFVKTARVQRRCEGCKNQGGGKKFILYHKSKQKAKVYKGETS